MAKAKKRTCCGQTMLTVTANDYIYTGNYSSKVNRIVLGKYCKVCKKTELDKAQP